MPFCGGQLYGFGVFGQNNTAIQVPPLRGRRADLVRSRHDQSQEYRKLPWNVQGKVRDMDRYGVPVRPGADRIHSHG